MSTEFRMVNGKEIACTQAGLWTGINDCGTRSRWFTYVFLGSITAISPAGQDEKKLQISPQEIFAGEPPASLKVLTSQGDCLPKLNVGDVWLFFLRKEPHKAIVIDFFSNPSLPAAQTIVCFFSA